MGTQIGIKLFKVTGCKVSKEKIFTGYVINVDNEPITDSIKRKVGVKALLCELTNEGFEYNQVRAYGIPLSELTLGDIVLVMQGFLLEEDFPD